MRKGRLVRVESKLQKRRWKKDGKYSDRFSTEILRVPGARAPFRIKPNDTGTPIPAAQAPVSGSAYWLAESRRWSLAICGGLFGDTCSARWAARSLRHRRTRNVCRRRQVGSPSVLWRIDWSRCRCVTDSGIEFGLFAYWSYRTNGWNIRECDAKRESRDFVARHVVQARSPITDADVRRVCP